MKIRRTVMILTMALMLLLGMTVSVNAEKKKVDGHCWFDGGSTIESEDFHDDTIATSISGLEPGDDVTFLVEFKNKYKDTTYWYMNSDVLQTLEESFDRTQNGGYTFRLTHIKPNGERQVLFSNEEVGGDTKVAGMEGLHQATNATKEWFFIQKLKPKQKAYTELYVKFDGETEVNDYMDTYGKLKVAYAVELENAGKTTNKVSGATSTGDDSNLLMLIAIMTLAALLALLTIMSWLRDRKEGEQE